MNFSEYIQQLAQHYAQGAAKADPDEVAYQKLLEIINRNKDKNFVQRLLRPQEFPVLDMGPGQYGSHMMSSGSADNQSMAYPEIVQLPGSNKLVRLNPRAAMEYAIKSKQFIPFKNDKEAQWFGENYKRLWGLRHSAPAMSDPLELP